MRDSGNTGFFLKGRSRDSQSSHFGKQCSSFQSQLRRVVHQRSSRPAPAFPRSGHDLNLQMSSMMEGNDAEWVSISSVHLFCATGFGSTPCRERITARSAKFCNSRMLPGQEYHWKADMVSGGIESTCFRIRRLKDFTNCVTSAGISPLPLSERGEQDREDIQKIIQIAPKLPASYHLDQMPIGCSCRRTST